MQKKIIVLAIAGLAAGSAVADTNVSVPVTFYGLLDGGFVSRSGTSAGLSSVGPTGAGAATGMTTTGTRNEITSVSAGSRIGLKGSHGLDSGLSAFYELEYGLNIDNAVGSGGTATASGTNQLWNRHSYIGLTGSFGTALIGRVDGARYSFINKYDPFEGGTVANSVSMIGGQVTRADNAIAYISPTFSDGFSVLAAYTTSLLGNENSNAGNAPVQQNGGDVRLWVLAPQYNNGPLSVTADFEGSTQSNTTNSALNLTVFTGGASYDLGTVKVMGFYDKVSDDLTVAGLKAIDWNAYGIGATVPVSEQLLVRANYTKLTDKSASKGDCNKIGIGLKYSWDKQISFGTDYASIGGINANGIYGAGACQIGYSGTQGAADVAQTANQSRYGTHGLDMYMAYKF